MKAISIRQPWAWAIVHAGKRIETRTRNIVGAYRGPILIHAAKGCTVREWVDAAQFIAARLREQGKTGGSLPLPHVIERGGIVGRAEIADVIRPREPDIDPYASDGVRWWNRDHYGIVLADVEPLPFVPWKGRLGLFDVPDDYAERTGA